MATSIKYAQHCTTICSERKDQKLTGAQRMSSDDAKVGIVSLTDFCEDLIIFLDIPRITF